MISEKVKQELFEEIRSLLKKRGSTLRALRYENGVVTECRQCKRVKKMSAAYWRGYDCYCTRSANISKSSLATDKFYSNVKTKHPNVKILGEFKGMNQKIEALCTVHNHKWTPWAGMLALGHGCRQCGSIKQNISRSNRSDQDKLKELTKRKRTMIKRYGVEHALQNKTFFDKNLITSSKLREVKLGKRTVRVQGYEPQGIAYILSKGVRPSSLVCGVGDKRMPTVEFKFKGKNRVYHPDVFLPKQNRIFEVKSIHTYKAALDLNLAKQRACELAGYKFTFLVMTKTGERIDHRNV